ncbi:MAG: hypothetical protein QOD51_1755 [Candidatus Eremiobacteraeota bacterium]|jgi:hypothetical protein|nr:hypothetical protein [Candidatus Eremiobacteraeota bacterium]
MILRFSRALTASAALAASIALMQLPAASQTPDKARFSRAGVYAGAPDLPLTVSMIVAGGGPAHFKSTTLVGTLAGAKTKAEVAKLTKQFGAKKLTSFLTVFDFVVADSLEIVTEKNVPLPKQPKPNPTDGKALAAALYTAGVDDGRYNVETMLDKLVSHPIHVQVMDDIDKKYGRDADANYHIVLTQAMLDLKAAYGL